MRKSRNSWKAKANSRATRLREQRKAEKRYKATIASLEAENAVLRLAKKLIEKQRE
jgi:hypothetical protein